MSRKDEAAWSDFWADNSRAGGGGCLPEGWRGIDAAQRACWQDFAKRLPRKARVLDLATGDGRVMGWLVKARSDIKATGVDLAPQLPPPPPGTKSRPGIAMEDLPFRDGSFDAVVSQFGFEYGNVGPVAKELVRVLKSDGVVALMTHRGDGPILAHNLERRAQIEWVIDDQNAFDKALNTLRLRSVGVAQIPALFEEMPRAGAAKFGEGSAAWEIPEAIRQTLHLGRRDDPRNVARTLQMIRAKAANEIGRIASLESACAVADDEERLAATFGAADLQIERCGPVVEENTDRRFADFRILSTI